MTFLKYVLFALIVGASHGAIAGDYDDIMSSADSDDLTPQERAHFTEALNRFPKKWISERFEYTSLVRWLDNQHLVFSTTKYPGWTAQKGEDPRIISVNVDTDEFVDLGYRGRLECLNHKRELMIRLRRAKIYNNSQDDHWFVGTVGQELQRIEWKPDYFVPRYTCRFAPIGDPIYTEQLKDLPPDAHRLIPLLPEHGTLKETYIFEDKVFKHPLALIKPDGTSVALPIRSPSAEFFNFQPWNSQYFDIRSTIDTPVSFDIQGVLFRHPPPKLLRFWHLSLTAQGTGYGTRLGMVWGVKGKYGKWRKQGIFLESAEGLLRIEDGGSPIGILVSPNGCRILAPLQRGNPWAKNPQKDSAMFIDLCKPGEFE